jgi:hypothetical protein
MGFVKTSKLGDELESLRSEVRNYFSIKIILETYKIKT